jgi:HAD superfamily hydrolase (TIGR01509 family)
LISLNWANIDTVLLDMDGTLLDLHFDNFFWLQHLPKRYAEENNTSVDLVIDKLQQQMRENQGTLNWYCTDFWSRQLDLDIIELKHEISHLIGERPFVRPFLETLGLHSKQRVLVTNAHRKSADIKFALTGIDNLLDSVISSHDYGQPKEDQRFWQCLHQSVGFDPERTLFIDDSEVILQSAQQYGIEHLLCIEKPDSKGESRISSNFPMISSFEQILSTGNE